MQMYVSYFYQVRFLKPYEVPLSTAVWDPKWYHEFQGQDHVFMDKRGVLNGVRASMFAPDETCENLCRGREGCPTGNPFICEFLRTYKKQIYAMNFKEFCSNMEQLSKLFQEQLKLSRPADFVLLVHEAPTNPCSERVVLQQWFQDNGSELPEWERAG